MATLNADARITVEELLDIIDTDLEESQINAFINTANNLVTAKLEDSGLDSTMLHDIELWLSAHFVCMRDMRAKSEDIAGEYRVTYQGETKTGLDATLYGQQALLLDYTGTLAALGLKKAWIEVFCEAEADVDGDGY